MHRALAEGPQRSTRREDAVVVLSEKDFQALTGQKPSLAGFLMEEGPDYDGVDLERDSSTMRDVDL